VLVAATRTCGLIYALTAALSPTDILPHGARQPPFNSPDKSNDYPEDTPDAPLARRRSSLLLGTGTGAGRSDADLLNVASGGGVGTPGLPGRKSSLFDMSEQFSRRRSSSFFGAGALNASGKVRRYLVYLAPL